MNERIRELAEQADIVFGFDKNNDPEVICAVMDIEKFAELLVRECAKTIESQDVDPSFKNRMSWAIKTKFGVE